MDLYIYSEGKNAQQITDACELLAGQPKLNLCPDTGQPPANSAELDITPAYAWLNDILQGNYVDQEWPFLDSAETVTMFAGSAEVALPCNFLRVQFDDALIILGAHNQRTPVRHVDPTAFWRGALSSSRAMPTRFTIDRKRSVIILDPTPDKSYVCELHYRFFIPRLTAITDVPFFPHKDYLEKQLKVMYYEQQNDSRIDGARNEAANAYARIRVAAYDNRDAENQIPLDSGFFPNVIHED